jgi:nicotinate phosphoribosyltransferase
MTASSPLASTQSSTDCFGPALGTPALLTDMYEYTMLDAALADGTANRQCVFEVYARHLPGNRRYGVVAGLGRLLPMIKNFRPSDEQIRYLIDNKIVSARTGRWLENYRFHGTIRAYPEGSVYFPNSPLLQVMTTFGEGTLLETLILSVLNYDSAVASAASRITMAAQDRPCFDMGGRRANEGAAVAAARSSIVGGFAGTANLAAAMKFGLKAIGTAAHCFTLVHDSEEDAFRSQIAALGKGTTLLTDTYNVEAAIRTAVKVAGPDLGGIRIDSGDLASMAQRARKQLDALGATKTKITVTNDLDEYSLLALRDAPVDSYGVGTRLVTGSGYPTCEMIYKLVEREGADGQMVGVAKKSAHKGNTKWRKDAYRAYKYGVADSEIVVSGPQQALDRWTSPYDTDEAASEGMTVRPLLITAVDHGDFDDSLTTTDALYAARDRHKKELASLPIQALSLQEGDPAIPTEMYDAE